jgi:hypothetical protein
VFTAQYGLIPYIKQITFRLYKVNSGESQASKGYMTAQLIAFEVRIVASRHQ